MAHSLDSPSHPDKRPRLSSPSYDEFVDEWDLDELKAIDQLEFSLSQAVPGPSVLPTKRSPQDARQAARNKRLQAIAEALKDINHGSSSGDDLHGTDDSVSMNHSSKSKMPGDDATKSDDYSGIGLKRGNDAYTSSPPTLQVQKGELTDEMDKFFSDSGIFMDESLLEANSDPLTTGDSPRPQEAQSSTALKLPLFQRASAFVPTPATTLSSSPIAGDPPTLANADLLSNTGFSTASGKSHVLAPSKAALELAMAKIQGWAEEDQETPESDAELMTELPAERPILGSLNNAELPSLAVRQGTQMGLGNASMMTPTRPQLPKSLGSSSVKRNGFKSPLMRNPAAGPSSLRGGVGILNLNSPSNRSLSSHNQNFRPPHPLSSTPITASPLLPPSTFTTTLPIIFHTPARRNASKPKFTTPFKPGMGPGETGRITLEKGQQERKKLVSQSWGSSGSPLKPSASRAIRKDSKPWRPTLETVGVRPQSYIVAELEAKGLNVQELKQITVETAIYYSFHTSSIEPPSNSFLPSTANVLGTQAAHAELLRNGCHLATQEWVDNHWRLILWKLAGMACLEPDKERGAERRWCWKEVIKQLNYRYDREIRNGSRPAFKLITTRDAPASSPMVICISNIIWPENGSETPIVEVTDGWYRLLADLDSTLVRAVTSGSIKVGRKLAVAGARLKSERKDPAEVLESYKHVRLSLAGNSTHLAPWHEKLGFQRKPSVATLRSLTPDGGLVPVMKLTIVKAFPIAFVEYKEDADGRMIKEGPWTEPEEARLMDKWRQTRDNEETRIRDELGTRLARLEGYADRLERLCAGRLKRQEDDLPPDHIEDLFDELVEANDDVLGFIKRLSHSDAGWLADFIRKQCDRDRGRLSEDIGQQLDTICPPRDARSFRVLLARDMETFRRPATRRAKLTVWDVLNISTTEGGKPGVFEEGQSFMVTNLVPGQKGAWMKHDKNSEVYLSTRRDTTWRRMR